MSEEFLRACENGDWKFVLKYQEEEESSQQQSKENSFLNPNPSFEDRGGKTALHIAARNGHFDVCALILDKILYHDDVNTFDDTLGFTPLHEAALGGHVSVCELLIRRGANVSALDFEHRTPFEIAKMQNHGDEICNLLKK